MKACHYLALALIAVASVPAIAGWGSHNCCQHCGCQCECEKVCRLVCETKVVTEATYDCKCEDFCVPGRSQRCGSDCGCGHCAACRQTSWIPVCATVKTRKVLVKKEEKIQKPTYKWVAEYLCPQCATGAGK